MTADIGKPVVILDYVQLIEAEVSRNARHLEVARSPKH